ncbi:MAG: DNA polymerase II small subunit, partial [Candidatus Odinarchaeota archaeon]|nr:DNA polymerase II small subunit [Candidatus Odinarchaeota archaeon]
IEQIPTILHTGHIHYNSYDIYKGVYIINSGTFQKQTEYQKMMGMVPTPAIVTIFNTKSLKINQLDFNY